MKPIIPISLYTFDEAYRSETNVFLCGVDEAGRGPLAGPVCAAAVILDPSKPIEGLNDSKKLSEKKREMLSPLIKESALAYAIVFADQIEIDRINILQATMRAMTQAVAALPIKPNLVLVDGDRLPPLPQGQAARNLVSGDALSASVAAASILAKVSRDGFMMAVHEQFPVYGFAKHKGYGTEAHYDAIRAYGICPLHRRSFLKNFDPTKMGKKELGQWGETVAAKALAKKGFTILNTNYHSRYGEIDLIGEDEKTLVFCEVKCFKRGSTYTPREAVSLAKQKKITKTAAVFLDQHKTEKALRFDVIELVAEERKTVEVHSFVWIEGAFSANLTEG